MRAITRSDISKFSFALFLIIMVFGTATPFREETIIDINEIGTSNTINQIAYILIFIMSYFVLAKKADQVLYIIKREKFLSLFLLWCFCSILWSNNPITSFKRLFQIITMTNVSLAVLIYSESLIDTLKSFSTIFYVYIVTSILLIALYPAGAIDIYGDWRGLAVHKNHFGQIVLVAIVLWSILINSDVKFKLINFLFLLLSIILLFGSKSSTSILTFMVLFSMVSLLYLVRTFNKIGMGMFFLVFTMLTICGMAILIYFSAPGLIDSALKIFGKDLTFSGRIELWGDLLSEVKKHLVLGYGYGGFWRIDNPDLIALYDKYTWMPLQGHNGYLDILNETGLVGISLLLCMIICYFKNLLLYGKTHFSTWFIIAALIINLQESILFNRGKLLSALFIFAYLSLYCEPEFMEAPQPQIVPYSTAEDYAY